MIWAIGDLHMDHMGTKPMDVFGANWINHEEKIFENWEKNVKKDDTVLLVGDHSWAMKLSEAAKDLKKINELPGDKYLIKGNHDYWWSSLRKMNNLGFDHIHFVHNNAYIINKIGIIGTRGWSDIDSIDSSKQDQKIYSRELNRLNLSYQHLLKQSKESTIEKIIAMIHYPPFSSKGEPNDFGNFLSKYNIDICVYGHLHSEGHRFAVEGTIDGVEYHCVASDFVNFKLRRIF